MPNTINYFLDVNSAKGYIDFFEENFRGKDIVFFQNVSQKIIQSVFNKLKKESDSRKIDIEVIRNNLDDTVMGIIIPDYNKGFINIQPYCQNEEHKISLLDENLKEALDKNLSQVYDNLAKALKVHDKWEEIYIRNIDFTELDKFTLEIIDKILKLGKAKLGSGKNINRFFGASTVYGPKDYIINLTDKLQHRYFIKGRPGTGKSTMLKKIIKAVNNNGFDTFAYHCAFDPNSLDMVIIPALDIAIFDSTAPHEHNTSKFCDEIIDVYARTVASDTDEKFKEELKNIEQEYRFYTSSALSYLKEVKLISDKIQLLNNASSVSEKIVLDAIL